MSDVRRRWLIVAVFANVAWVADDAARRGIAFGRFDIAMTLVLGGLIIIWAILIPFFGHFRAIRPRALVFAGCFLLVWGTIGGYSQSLSRSGGLNGLPRSWEWPVGSSDGVITMPDGTHVVPQIGPGRVQVYDSHWKFLRGWAIVSRGRDFKVIPTGPDRFDVFYYGSLWRKTYRLSGDLVASGTGPPGGYDGVPNMGQRHSFHTAPWLLVFVGSFSSWFVGLGVGVLALLQWWEARARSELLKV